MDHTITFLPSGKTINISHNATIMDAERIAGLGMEYPCGGNGTCNKCTVEISYGDTKKSVKACTYKIERDMTVTLRTDNLDHNEKVLTESGQDVIDCNPCISVYNVQVDEAKIGDVRSDFCRFSDACKKDLGMVEVRYNSTSVLTKLSELFSKDIFNIKAVFYGNTLLDVRIDDFTPLAIAYDIGTTTIAGYLLDMSLGTELCSCGALNEQVRYGGDVISRCIFAMENSVEEIQNCVNKEVDSLALKMLNDCGKKAEDVYAVSIVGNTCMHHIFAGINPISLVNAPYTPSVSDQLTLDAAGYFSNVNPNAKLVMLPVIAGFIGADTVSVLVSADFPSKEKPTLMLDIGTNGEMALGTKERWVTCSTASGPAFEGAKIVKGMRGAPGAVDHVWMENGEFKFSTIDNQTAIGICGSGLVDVIKVMLEEEVIIPSGRFNKKYEGTLSDKILTIDGAKCFVITPEVYITQKDVREVQLAKGAIAAGIEIMAEKLDITYDDIEEVLIAGAFGNYMKPESMCKLKMIPPQLLDKIVPIGNAAGSGAKLCLINKEKLETAKYISEKSEFIELATHPSFQEKFIKQLDF